ncbi:MAG: YIP1 family protein [Chloroflexota bacterium]
MLKSKTFDTRNAPDQLLDIVVRPNVAFNRVATNPRVLPSLLFVLGSTLLMYIALSEAFSNRIRDALAQVDVIATSRLIYLALTLSGVLSVLQIIITIFISALIIHVVARFLTGKASLYTTLACYTVALIPSGLKGILIAVLALFLGSENTPLTIVSFGGDAASNISATLDPFALWSTVLLGIGLRQAHQLNPVAAFGIAFGFFFTGILIPLIPTILLRVM